MYSDDYFSLPTDHGVSWWCEQIVGDRGDLLGVRLRFRLPTHCPMQDLNVGISFMCFRDGQVFDYINSERERFFMGHERLMFRGAEIRIPCDPAGYLEHHYGEWRKPTRDLAFSEIRYFRAPEARITVRPLQPEA